MNDAAAGGGRVDILLDAGDDVAVTRGLLRSHDPAAGRIVVHPSTTAGSLAGLAHDILAALGAPITALDADRLAGAVPAWRAAWSWLPTDRVTDRVQHLVMLRAHRLDRTLWTALAEMAAATGVQVLLVCHRPRVPNHLYQAVARARPRLFADLATAATAFGWCPPTPPPGPQQPTVAAVSSVAGAQFAPLPRLPAAQVLYYRADVYRQYNREVFARVDALYGRGMDAACRWIRKHPGHGEPERGAPELGAVVLQRFLVELVHASPTPQHTLALLRGAQAGFLAHGWWLGLPNLSGLGGPGLTSVPITAEIVARIRAGTAHPVIAAGVVLALFTGVKALSLRPLPLDAVPASTRLVAMSFQWQSVGAVHRREFGHGGTEIPTGVTTAVFHIPRAARPLLRAARAFLAMRSDDPRQRVFAGLTPMHEVVEQAAARCGTPLSRRAVPLVGAWQMRVKLTRLGEPLHREPVHREPVHLEPVHREPPGPTQTAGLTCGTARPAAPDPAATPPLYRNPNQFLGQRWSPRGGHAPTTAFRLLHTWLEHPDGHEIPSAPPDSLPSVMSPQQRDFVEAHLGVDVPPVAPGFARRFTVHPDITFALRCTDRPGPGGPHSPASR